MTAALIERRNVLRVPSICVTSFAMQTPETISKPHTEQQSVEEKPVRFAAATQNWKGNANIAMQEEGFSAECSALVRAVYFAREWAINVEDFDGVAPIPIYSQP